MRLQDALRRFLTQLQADGRSPHTIGQYRRSVEQFGAWASRSGVPEDVAEIDHEDLARFMASPEARGGVHGRARSSRSLNALRTGLRSFFDYLQRAGALEHNPARVLRMARVGTSPPASLQPREAERLLACLAADESGAGRRDHAFFAFLLGTGARLGSALALDVGDLDLEGGQAHLRELKGGGTLPVFLNRGLVRLLGAYLRERAQGPLFLGHGERRLSRRHAQRRFALWLSRAGIRRRLSPHCLRHTFAMRLYERTGDLLVVQEALGHRSIVSTMVYARASAERVRAAVVGSA